MKSILVLTTQRVNHNIPELLLCSACGMSGHARCALGAPRGCCRETLLTLIIHTCIHCKCYHILLNISCLNLSVKNKVQFEIGTEIWWCPENMFENYHLQHVCYYVSTCCSWLVAHQARKPISRKYSAGPWSARGLEPVYQTASTWVLSCCTEVLAENVYAAGSIKRLFSILRPRQNGRQFPDNFKGIFLNENI